MFVHPLRGLKRFVNIDNAHMDIHLDIEAELKVVSYTVFV